jgi:phytoene dehydrogenase-like protein
MYDLIVIGDDLSSYVAAAVATGCGLNTALLTEVDNSGTYSDGDFSFNFDPTPLSGFGNNQLCFSLLDALNIPLDGMGGQLLNPSYQIILPEHRIDFFHEKDSLINEMAREFPAYIREINSFYDSAIKYSSIFSTWLKEHPFVQPQSIKDCYKYLKLIPHFLKQKYKKSKLEKIIFSDASLKKIFEAQQILMSYTNAVQNRFAADFIYAMPLRGVYCFPKGKQILFNALINKIESGNSIKLTNCDITNIKKGKLIELELTDKNGDTTILEARNLIVSTKWEKMNLLLENKKRINIGDWLRPVTVSRFPFTIHLGCDRQCLPEKMARHVALVMDVDKDIYDDNIIIIESVISSDETASAKNKVSLTATVYLPSDPGMWSQESLEKIAASILAKLEQFLPFLKENIEFYDLNKSIEISKMCRKIVNPKYQMKNSFLTGFAARSNKTRFKNVFLTGASLLVDAGFEGEIISGMNAVSRVVGKKV